MSHCYRAATAGCGPGRTQDANDALPTRCVCSGVGQAARQGDVPLAQHERFDHAQILAGRPVNRGRPAWRNSQGRHRGHDMFEKQKTASVKVRQGLTHAIECGGHGECC